MEGPLLTRLISELREADEAIAELEVLKGDNVIARDLILDVINGICKHATDVVWVNDDETAVEALSYIAITYFDATDEMVDKAMQVGGTDGTAQ